MLRDRGGLLERSAAVVITAHVDVAELAGALFTGSCCHARQPCGAVSFSRLLGGSEGWDWEQAGVGRGSGGCRRC